MNKSQQKLLVFAFIVVVALGVWQPWRLTVISVSTLNIDPQGYEDPATHEWSGSFWSVEMLVDADEGIGALLLGNEGNTPEGTFVAGAWSGEKTYANTYTVDGQELIPQSEVQINLSPLQPYYERPLEIQQGMYAPATDGTWEGKIIPTYGRLESQSVSQASFVHKSFGSGSWELHTPFEVSVYKDGALLSKKTIDTVGGTQVYRIPETGPEYIRLTDLGKVGTGYGEPQWDDIIYFSSQYIFVGDSAVRSLLQYDGGVAPHVEDGWNTVYPVDAYSTYWYGHGRWEDDSSPMAISYTGGENGLLNGDDYGGWTNGGDSVNYWRVPNKVPVFPGDKPFGKQAFKSVVEWLDYKGVNRANPPTWLDTLEVREGNKLRLYMPYGAVNSWVTLQISTELADTIVWTPQVGNFKITSFEDFGDIADQVTASLTVECLEGRGSSTVWLEKIPSTTPVSFPPAIGLPVLSAGESHTVEFTLLNLGTDTARTFTVKANVQNSLGTFTGYAEASGKLLVKTGETTVLHVQTLYDNKPISGLPVVVEYAEQSKSDITDSEGAGLATFSLESYSGSVSARFYGNEVYLPESSTVSVNKGSETTVTFNLRKTPAPPPKGNWLWMLLFIPVGAVGFFFVYKKWRRR